MAIKPVDIPTAGGIDYGGGDVRHFSDGDAINVPGLASPTRQLAERDNALASKLNEVIGTVNNTERLLSVPLVRTTVPPVDEIVVANQRIPEGYEARILNAAIACFPASTDAELIVYYNAGFGGMTGTSVINTSTEFSGGVQFYQEGEFIVVLRNKSALSLDIAASVMLSTRPLGGQGGLLVGTAVKGDKGDPGLTGPPGPPGQPGTGGAGSPGMVWTGVWSSLSAYSVNQVVSYTTGGITSSYICTASHGPTVTTPDANPTQWNAVATGSAGTTGPAGPAGSGSSVFTSVSTSGTFYTGASYVPDYYNETYKASPVLLPSTKYGLAFKESAVRNPTGTDGISTLHATYYTCFKGQGTIHFPQIGFNGAVCDYTADDIHLLAASNGTIQVQSGTYFESGSIASILVERHPANTGYIITVIADQPIPVSIMVAGVQQVV